MKCTSIELTHLKVLISEIYSKFTWEKKMPPAQAQGEEHQQDGTWIPENRWIQKWVSLAATSWGMPLCKPSLLLSAPKYLLLPTTCLWDSCYWIVAFFYFLHPHTEHQGPFPKATIAPSIAVFVNSASWPHGKTPRKSPSRRIWKALLFEGVQILSSARSRTALTQSRFCFIHTVGLWGDI